MARKTHQETVTDAATGQVVRVSAVRTAAGDYLVRVTNPGTLIGSIEKAAKGWVGFDQASQQEVAAAGSLSEALVEMGHHYLSQHTTTEQGA